MANKKITELNELTTPTVNDVLPIVTDTGGTPTTYKTKFLYLLELGPQPATVSEINTATEADNFITPDALNGSIPGTKYICKFVPGAVASGNGYMQVPVPEWAWNSDLPWELATVEATVDTAGTTNSTTIQLYNGSNNMLSTVMTIETGELTSMDAATAAEIDSSYQSLSGIKQIRVDITAVSTTPPQGLTIILGIRRP